MKCHRDRDWNIHCLTEKGAQLLSDIYGQPIEDFPFPKGKVQFADNRLAHRQAQVDFHIGLQFWAYQNEDIELVLAEQDFMVTGSRRFKNFIPLTEIKILGSKMPIIPDGIFWHRAVIKLPSIVRSGSA